MPEEPEESKEAEEPKPAEATDSKEKTPPSRKKAPSLKKAPSRNPLRRLYNWILSWADHKYGGWALFFLAMAESVFFPLPPDFLLIALILSRREKALRLATICTLGSLAGAVIGYRIGIDFWAATQDFWFEYVFSHEKFMLVNDWYQKWDWLAIFVAAFTLIPYKVFTITAGVFGIDFFGFMLASLVGRAGRFFLVAGIFYLIGTKAKPFIEKWLNWIALVVVILIILGFWILGKF